MCSLDFRPALLPLATLLTLGLAGSVDAQTCFTPMHDDIENAQKIGWEGVGVLGFALQQDLDCAEGSIAQGAWNESACEPPSGPDQDVWYLYTNLYTDAKVLEFDWQTTQFSAVTLYDVPTVAPLACAQSNSSLPGYLNYVLPAGEQVWIRVAQDSQAANGFFYVIQTESIAVESLETVRLGTPPNPDVLIPGDTNGPVVGKVWDPRINHWSFMPDATLDVLVIGTLSMNLPTASGTLLVLPLLGTYHLETTAPGTSFAIALPDKPALVGVEVYAQGASVNATTFQLTNGLDLVFGTY